MHVKTFVKFLEIKQSLIKDLFRCEEILDFAIVALSFVYDKYCPIIN